MATIGTFKKTGSNDFTGEIVTLSVQAKAVRIVPEDSTPNENAPSYRVFVGRAEIGAGPTAWSAGSTWVVQAAFRDAGGATGFNATNAMRVTFNR